MLVLKSVLLAGLAAMPCAADDVVTLVPADPHAEPTMVRGTVLEYTGQELRIRTPAGETTLSATKVAKVDTNYPPQYGQALTLLTSGKSSAAAQLLDEAALGETRPWVRRAILARQAIALHAAGQPSSAGDLALQIVEEDPYTVHLEALPLAWGSFPPNFERDRAARRWLQMPSLQAQLMGASWLVTTADRADALRVLQNLRKANQPPIALLAEAQLWRTQIVTATATQAEQWQNQLEAGVLKGPVTAGPYLTLGKVWRQLANDTTAALLLIRPAILYPEQRAIAADGLLQSARILHESGRSAEALRLVREIIELYSDQPARQEAATLYQQLAGAGGN